MNYKKIISTPWLGITLNWITLTAIFIKYSKELLKTMNSYPLWIISLLIVGFSITATIFSFYSYRNSNTLSNTVSSMGANIYHNFAIFNYEPPINSFIFTLLALKECIKNKDLQMTRDLLNELILIIKNMGDDTLSTKDVSVLNEIISKIDQKKFATEISKINKLTD